MYQVRKHWLNLCSIVTKVAFRNDPESALIQFASPEEASRAIRSTEAVLDNRFICMRWYRGNDGAEPQPQAQLATVKVKLILRQQYP